MMKKNLFQILFTSVLIVTTSVLTGCASFSDLMASIDGSDKKPILQDVKKSPRYSENQNMAVPTDRQYHHMTRSKMEDESDLGSNAGSTWVMDGQGSYLFAQNKMRREGDLTNVKLDGPAMKQVETKVSVIKKLLKQLEEQEALNNSLAAAGGDLTRTPAAVATAAGAAPAADAKKDEPKKEDDDKEALAEVQSVPSRIVEKLPDGNYRIKGQQPFMIGKREYKVIVTGMLRPEDFNDEGIGSQKLLDPQYDVVSIRKNSHND